MMIYKYDEDGKKWKKLFDFANYKKIKKIFKVTKSNKLNLFKKCKEEYNYWNINSLYKVNTLLNKKLILFDY